MIQIQAEKTDLLSLGAKKIAEFLGELHSASPSETEIVWGLCGGRSPVGLFSALIPELQQLPSDLLSRLRFLQVDERLYAEHNQTDLQTQIFEPLLQLGLIAPEQVFLFPLPETEENQAALVSAQQYESLLSTLGGRFHLVILGVGEDGHVAGTFPNHPSSEELREGFFVYESSPKPPSGRVTATLSLLERSDLGVLLFLGEGKRTAFERFQDPSVPELDCPAKIVLSMKEQLILSDILPLETE